MEMPWLTCHNLEIDWRTGKVKMTRCSEINWKTEEVKMTRCPEECEKQWRPVQEKLGWEKQKKKEEKEEVGKKQKMMEVKKVVEKWEIWGEEEEAVRSEEKVKKMVHEKFHQ